ncbi:phytoene desaturase family protein [Tautonia sociabilis]|uniref:FAD-binding protein n=1 Tax=Tautonia sociabilis TaxID=2080755 RepID=A0A432MKV0_9BACT|nr:NAD(P)-binding protein [Tautonia sociabilis]RUL87889.1 FAD-binding protein [Tautonia sociabilis]
MDDLIVIGGGWGGLATAALARARGLKVTLLEAHTKLGGCAGWFDRGPWTFDVGATALMGLGPDEPVGGLLRTIGLPVEAAQSPSVRLCLPDRTLDLVSDSAQFEQNIRRVFPGRDWARIGFWRLQEAVGSALFRAANRVPRLPVRSVGDLAYDLRVLGPGGLLAASTWPLSVLDVLRLLGLADDVPFRSLVAMLLQDTAQAGPETVPFANASACLQAYRMGMSRPVGGMRGIAEGIGSRFEELGGTLLRGTIVDRVEPDGHGGFLVVTRRRKRLAAREVAFNLPIELAARLLGRTLDGQLARRERRSRAVWSAVTGYVAIRAEAVPEDGPLFYQVLRDYRAPMHDGNNVLISLSPPGDPGYGPPEVRVATMSTHVCPVAWEGLSHQDHAAEKSAYRTRLLDALGRALPRAPEALVHAEFGSPRSFARYTRRLLGAVGGPPVSRRNSNFLAVGSDVLGPGLWIVGDSVFPGQGTMAVVLSAIRVVERITGQSWERMRREPAAAAAAAIPVDGGGVLAPFR